MSDIAPAPAEATSSLKRRLVDGTVVAAVIVAFGSSVVAVVGWVTEHDSQRASARGAARLMQTEFLRRYCDLNSISKRSRFPRVDVDDFSRLSPEQRLQVAARMTAHDWAAVAQAEIRIPRAERLLERRRGAPLSDPSRTPRQQLAIRGEIIVLKDYRSGFARAFRALSAPGSADVFAGVDIEDLCPREAQAS